MEAGIDRNNAEAGLEARQHRLEELAAVPLENGNTVAPVEPQRFQRQRERVDSEFFLLIRRATLTVSDSQSIRNLLRRARQVCADVQCGRAGHAPPVYA